MIKNLIIKTILSFTLLTVFLYCNGQSERPNPYHLNVISNISEYKNLIAQNPDKTLVDIEKYIPSIVLDIRYATENNFTHQKMYESAKAFLRKPVADSLLKVQNELQMKGIGLKIFDAYRPYSVTVKLFKIIPDTTFAAPPSTGSLVILVINPRNSEVVSGATVTSTNQPGPSALYGTNFIIFV